MDNLKSSKLDFWSIFFLGVNSIIGSGIFLLPNKVYKDIGMTSIIVILINAFLALSLALCFAECASRFKENGSAFLYSKAAFGNFMGFEVGIFTWFIGIVSWAAETQGFLTILNSLFPALKDPLYNKILVVIICSLLGLFNYSGVDFSKILNNIITITKLIPLVLFISIGIFYIHLHDFIPFITKVSSNIFSSNFGSATLLIFYAFTGFDLLAVAAGDMKNPQKNLPKAIISVICFCSIFYLIIMLICIGILGNDLGNTTVPIASATSKFLGNFGFLFVTIATLISIGGITIALSFIAPRSIVAMSENNYFPKKFAKVGKRNTPGLAIFLSTLIVIILGTYGDFIFLAGLTVIARLVEYIPTAFAVIVLRKKLTTEPLYKIPFGITIPIFAILVSLWLLSQATLEKILFGLGGLILGGILYFYFIKIKGKN
ncbi:MAG: APC family permease [Cetobacterium sp.]|nr:APC family permease [Cetobacterium sp.]